MFRVCARFAEIATRSLAVHLPFGEQGMEEDGPASGAVNGSTASTRGFLAEDGLRYLNITGDGSASTFTSQRKLRCISRQ